MENNIGNKIKYFRKQANMSQLEVETELDMSPGSMSRIESGQTNPTKETLLKFTQLFTLSIHEQMYLLGLITQQVSKEEIEKARSYVRPFFEKDEFYGYLLDDRWTFIDFSRGMAKLMGVPLFLANSLRGKSFPKIIFNPKSPIYKYIKWEDNIEMAEVQLIRMTKQYAYLDQEVWFQELYQELLTYPVIQIAAENLKHKPEPDVISNNARKIHLNIKGKELVLMYSRELLKDNPRFYLMEYTVIENNRR